MIFAAVRLIPEEKTASVVAIGFTLNSVVKRMNEVAREDGLWGPAGFLDADPHWYGPAGEHAWIEAHEPVDGIIELLATVAQ